VGLYLILPYAFKTLCLIKQSDLFFCPLLKLWVFLERSIANYRTVDYCQSDSECCLTLQKTV